jgi:hypothetical protein
MDDYIWVTCPNGHGKPGEQHFDYCGLCPECGAVLMKIAEPKDDAPLVRADLEG